MRRLLHQLSRRAPRALLALGILAMPATAAAVIDTSNIGSTVQKWDFPTMQVTAQPIVYKGRVYAGAWNGIMYALNARDGSILWTFDTGSGSQLGIQSTVLITDDGMACFGDSNAHVWCRDAITGAAVWDKNVNLRQACSTDEFLQCTADSDCPGAGTCDAIDHIWSGLATANGRLIVSLASHSDQPCTQGQLVALDLATGADLWSLQTVPDKICSTDTATVCTADSDCPAGGLCRDALGAGITATVSFDPTGDFLYMNTVGCFTHPSVGDSDSIFKVDATNGSVVWKTRVNPPEQFGACTGDTSIECGTNSDCTGFGTCATKGFYHDFGFLNGPTPVEILGGTKTVLISGSKDGTLYALNEPTGTIEWTNAVLPVPVTPAFAGFGLFNGPLGFGDGRVYAALFEFVEFVPPGPAINRMRAFDADTGALVWSKPHFPAWSGSSFANGVVVAGYNGSLFSAPPAIRQAIAYDASNGDILRNFILPQFTSSLATFTPDSMYIGYGILNPAGGVRAYELPIDRNDVVKCTRAINKGTTKYIKAVQKEIDKCKKNSIGKNDPPFVPDFVGACDLATLKPGSLVNPTKIDKAAVKFAEGIAKKCCGKDQTCGSGTGDDADLPLDVLNWDLEGGTCMGFEGNCGAIPVADGSGIFACLECVIDDALEQAVDGLIYDEFNPANFALNNPANADPEKSRLKCQQTIAKEAGKFLLAKQKILGKCTDKKLKEQFDKFGEFAACPDADLSGLPLGPGPDPNKSVAKIVKAELKKVGKICKKCGGVGDGDKNGICDGSEDVGGAPLALADIVDAGFVCPAVTVPANAVNGQTPEPCTQYNPVDSLQKYIDCIDCVLEFKADCLSFAAAGDGFAGDGRGFEYPAECE